jgi:bacterial/archaeal transporter family protein
MALILLLWGIWGFFPKLATGHLSSKSAMVFQAIGSLLVSLYALWSVGFRPDVHPQGIAYSIIAGAAAGLGSLILLNLLKTESATVAIGVTALYPVVTIALAMVFLGETLTMRQGIGVVLSMAALVLIAG